jgi:hypothetical protein
MYVNVPGVAFMVLIHTAVCVAAGVTLAKGYNEACLVMLCVSFFLQLFCVLLPFRTHYRRSMRATSFLAEA